MAANGNKYDWESITVTLPGGEAVAITEIKYEDGQGVTARYGRGGAATVAATMRRRAAWFWTARNGKSSRRN